MENKFNVGEFILTKNGTVYYVKDICNCKYCQKRGMFEPILYQYNKGKFPFAEGYTISVYMAQAILDDMVDRTYNKDTKWVEDALNDAKECINQYYNVEVKEQHRSDLDKFIDIISI